jgi:hypothetical protein
LREFLNHEYVEYLNYILEKGISHSLYWDYFKACRELELDMSLERNRFPHDFKHWHDVRIDEYRSKRAMLDEKKRAEHYRQFASVAEKYLSLQKAEKGAYLVLIAKSPAELVKEGEILHHCVGGMGYDQKFVREETLIFFIRSTDQPDVPLVTVEYSLKTHKILQCYADHNTAPTQEITDFVHKRWLPYANRKLKKIAA